MTSFHLEIRTSSLRGRTVPGHGASQWRSHAAPQSAAGIVRCLGQGAPAPVLLLPGAQGTGGSGVAGYWEPPLPTKESWTPPPPPQPFTPCLHPQSPSWSAAAAPTPRDLTLQACPSSRAALWASSGFSITLPVCPEKSMATREFSETLRCKRSHRSRESGGGRPQAARATGAASPTL